MPKIKIFTAKNVRQYGFTDREIEALNAEWELKAADLGLEEHLPEYWQEAKRHMNEKLAGRVAVVAEQNGPSQPDGGETAELPSLDVSLDDFDLDGEEELAVVDLPDEDFEVEFLADEPAELEAIVGDNLELEVIPEEQMVSFEELAVEETAEEEPGAVAELELAEEEAIHEQAVAVEEMIEEEQPVEQPAAAAEWEFEEDEAFHEAVAVEEMVEEQHPAEEPAEEEPAEEETELAAGETVQGPCAFGENAREIAAEEEPAPVAEQTKSSFFGKIMAGLKKMFGG
jgi:hypothetical protein